jgi:hypothetical protein
MIPEIIEKVISYMDIDSKLRFGIPPGKINEDAAWSLWYRLTSHDGLVYLSESHTLYNLRHHEPGIIMTIRRPIELSYIDYEDSNNGFSIFNLNNLGYSRETYYENNSVIFSPIENETWSTELRILFK